MLNLKYVIEYAVSNIVPIHTAKFMNTCVISATKLNIHAMTIFKPQGGNKAVSALPQEHLLDYGTC